LACLVIIFLKLLLCLYYVHSWIMKLLCILNS
jgi:hypothetical protein